MNFTLILLLIFIPIYASSPVFSRQIIYDNKLGDNVTLEYDPFSKGSYDCKQLLKESKFPSIEKVLYWSNGEELKSIFLLSDNYKEKINITRVFQMIIDVDPSVSMNQKKSSKDEIDKDEIDLDYQLLKMETNNVWDKKLYELYFGNKQSIDLPADNSRFNEDEKYVEVSLDLDKINNPKTYSVFFVLEYYYKINDVPYCSFLDITDPGFIPPHQFSITINPDIIELKPGELKPIEFIVNTTNQKLVTPVDITFKQIDLENSDNVEIIFSKNKKMTMPAKTEIGIKTAKIKVPEGLNDGIRTLTVETRFNITSYSLNSSAKSIAINDNFAFEESEDRKSDRTSNLPKPEVYKASNSLPNLQKIKQTFAESINNKEERDKNKASIVGENLAQNKETRDNRDIKKGEHYEGKSPFTSIQTYKETEKKEGETGLDIIMDILENVKFEVQNKNTKKPIDDRIYIPIRIIANPTINEQFFEFWKTYGPLMALILSPILGLLFSRSKKNQ